MCFYLFTDIFLVFLTSQCIRLSARTSALSYCFGEFVAFFQNSLPLTLGPLVESEGEAVHLDLEIIKGKVNRSERSDGD